MGFLKPRPVAISSYVHRNSSYLMHHVDGKLVIFDFQKGILYAKETERGDIDLNSHEPLLAYKAMDGL